MGYIVHSPPSDIDFIAAPFNIHWQPLAARIRSPQFVWLGGVPPGNRYQEISLDVNFWRKLWSSVDLADRPLMDCVHVIHIDLMEVWNLKDKAEVCSPQLRDRL